MWVILRFLIIETQIISIIVVEVLYKLIQTSTVNLERYFKKKNNLSRSEAPESSTFSNIYFLIAAAASTPLDQQYPKQGSRF